MGFDDIVNFASGNAMPLISTAASVAGGLFGNQSRQEQAAQANQFSASQFAHRYQTTTKDMMAAGLNPMLAYSQGGGSPPTGQQASQEDVLTPAMDTFNKGVQAQSQSRMTSAQVANIEADTANKGAQADLMRAQAAQAQSSAWAQSEQTQVNMQTVEKIKSEISNLKIQSEVLFATVHQLHALEVKLEEQGKTEAEIRAQLRATAAKAVSETKLNNLDIKAAEDLGNVGRYSGELKPVFDILRGLLRK